MQEEFKQTYQILEKATSECSADYLSLSGGLDSTILAYFLKKKKINTITVVANDFVANDLVYSQIAAKEFDLPLMIKTFDTTKIIEGVEKTIEILKNFNDIEIRNNVAMYLSLFEIKQAGFDRIITGDGADELFAGYNFLLKKDSKSLESDLKRLAKIMHFPSQKLGKSIGIQVESPFCHDLVKDFAKTLPTYLLVRDENNEKFGKWILRKTFEDKIPKIIAWRQKSPMQDGSGTHGLTEFFNTVISDEVFLKRTKIIKEKDNVIIRTKESLHYYEVYRKYHTLKISKSDSKCPDCQYTIEENSRFCRMCGRFPV